MRHKLTRCKIKNVRTKEVMYKGDIYFHTCYMQELPEMFPYIFNIKRINKRHRKENIFKGKQFISTAVGVAGRRPSVSNTREHRNMGRHVGL